MADLRFEKEITALLVIDPYNDFISEGGKLWDRIKGVAEANDCVRHMLQVLTAARETLETTRRGNMWRQSRKQPGHERPSNTAPGAVNVAPNSRLSRAKSLLRSIGVPADLRIRIWIYS